MLILKKFIIPERKIVKTQVLANDRRDRIYNFILNNPGAHLREIRDNLNIQPYLTSLHLKILEDFQYIYQKKYLKYTVYFPFNFDPNNEMPILAVKNQIAAQICKKILDSNEISLSGLKSSFSEDSSPKTINYHLEPLLSSNLIIKTEKNNEEFFKINQEVFEKVRKYISVKIGLEVIDPIVVKRAYDYVGGDIRFKVVVENISNKSIENIIVKLDGKEQYDMKKIEQKISVLQPQE